MKIPSVLKKLLTNRVVLHVVSIITFLNMIGYLISGKFTAVLFFVVLAILINHFSKNMIIVLGIPLILVNLFVLNNISNIEGMETNTPDVQNTVKDKVLDVSANEVKENNNQDPKSKQNLSLTPLDPTKKTDESFEVGRAKKRGGGYDIDYAATIEDAYDQLNNILGSDGIKRLTDDSQKLMKQQMELAESMKAMGPLIQGMKPMMDQAKGMLEGMGNGNAGLDGIMEMAKKFGVDTSKK